MSSGTEVPVARDTNLGRTIAGRYQITRRLGGGGMGVVYLAEHTAIGKRVAVKMLHAQYASEPEVVRRFLNEARAAAMVGHRNIVDAIDFGQTEEGAPYLVLEYLEGHDLRAEMEQSGPLAPARAAAIALQIAAGLGAAHAKGIVHRDMKPDNVFLVAGEPDGSEVRILDFGISKVVEHNSSGGGTKTGAVMGTPQYMAPEQFIDASRVDPRCDVWALGVMLYQMLSGAVPYDAASFGALAIAVMQTSPVPLAERRPDTPRPLVELVDAMLAREIDRRPSSMSQVIAALEPIAGVRVERGDASVRLSTASPASAPTPSLTPFVSEHDIAPAAKPRSLALPLGIGGAVAVALVVGGIVLASSSEETPVAPTAAAAPPPAVPVAPPPVEAVAPPAPELPVAVDPPAEPVETEVITRVQRARERGDVHAAITALGASHRRREQLSHEDLALINTLCDDTLGVAEGRLDGDDRNPQEALRLAQLVAALTLAAPEHHARAQDIARRAEAQLAAIARAAAEREAAERREAEERAAAERARAAAAAQAAESPTRASSSRRTRQLESDNPY